MPKKKELISPILDKSFDEFFIKIFDLKNTLKSFNDINNNYIYTKDATQNEPNKIIWKKFSKKLVNGEMDSNYTTLKTTEKELFNKLFSNESIILYEPEFKYIELKLLFIKIFKKLGIKDENELAAVLLFILNSNSLNVKTFKGCDKKLLDLIKNKEVYKLISKKPIDRETLEETIDKIYDFKYFNKNDKWFDKKLFLPGIYFVEHSIQMFLKIINLYQK